MASSRGKGKVPVKIPARRAEARQSRNGDGHVPDVFQSMLAEAEVEMRSDDDERPVKKRKVRTKTPRVREIDSSPGLSEVLASYAKTNGQPVDDPISSLQTVQESSESDASDFEFEDVDIDIPNDDAADVTIEDLSILVQADSSTRRAISAHPRRKPASTAEKARRLFIHKLHVLCLMSHCIFVNGRCNNPAAQRHLRKLLSSNTVSYLNPKQSESQFQRNRSFMDGLQQAVDAFNAEYRCGGAGMTRPQWTADGEAGKLFDSHPIDAAAFVTAAKDLEGTQDMGNALFCAMLRSAGVDARLVCSLQVLPFVGGAKPATPRKPAKEVVLATSTYEIPTTKVIEPSDTSLANSSTIGKVPNARRRLGQPYFESQKSITSTTATKSKLRPAPKLSYPVLWVEAFNAAQQKWIPIDAVVTHTVNKTSKIEPPASYEYNQLLYAIAFEDDGSARDVTRRYAKAYNAKTRRRRVETSAEGAKWFKRMMRHFRRPAHFDRDQVEDAELAQYEAREGMPANVLDFKDHPYYVLERHLKRHQVIHPRREVGKVNAGTAANPRIEPVFRRRDVVVCRSANKWYRIGREIKEGEQPLKHVPAQNRRPRSLDKDEEDAAATTGLYGPEQTQLYVPPPVERGRIPKNVYGNLDVYAPSMLPAGSVHIRHSFAQRAAKLLRIDYADAVTGFRFQGRHGTAIIEGAVVAQPFQEAIEAVIQGFEDEQTEEASRARSVRALQVWKRFLTGLKIRQRVVEGYGGGSERVEDAEEENAKAIEAASVLEDLDDGPMVTAGKYSIEELLAPMSKPTKGKKKRATDDDSEAESVRVESEQHYPNGPLWDSADGAGGFLPDGDGGGGFLLDGDGDGDGGFLRNGNGGDGFLPDGEGGGGAGRFLPGGDESNGQGRGFLLGADEDSAGSAFDEHHRRLGSFLPEEIGETGGGFIPAENDPQAEQRNAVSERSHEPDEFNVLHAREGTDAEDQDEIREHSMAPTVDDQSLPSHDSEDEEAEPDWLDSD